MPRSPFEPFTTVGVTPTMKIRGGAVALSPVAPLVAETGALNKDNNVLRITNYQTGTVVELPVPFSSCHTVSFSPDGKRLFALPGIKGYWNSPSLILCSEPWTALHSIYEQHILERYNTSARIFHATWLDEQTILMAGSVNYYDPFIVVLDVSGESLRIVSLEDSLPSSMSSRSPIESAVCSPSGHIAFSMDYRRQIVVCQLNQARDTIESKFVFPLSDDRYDGSILIEENGQTLILYGYGASVFTCQGLQCGSLDLSVSKSAEAVYRYGTVCLQENNRYDNKLHIYQVRNGQFLPWGSRYRSHGRGIDLALHDGKILLAIEEEDHTTISELTDFDIVQLGSTDTRQRVAAAQSLGRRRLQSAVRALEATLRDEVVGVQVAAIEALAEIGDPNALPSLLRALGHTRNHDLQNVLLLALRRFSIAQLDPAILDCLSRSGSTYRRGAVRILNDMLTIKALEELCNAVNDGDQEVRVIATHALQKRGDLRACIALLAHLNNEDRQFRLTVQQAVIALLEASQLLSIEVRAQLALPMDVLTYANEVIMTGRIHAFDSIGDPLVGKFLIGLAVACTQTRHSLPQLLTALDALASHHATADRTSVSIGLTIALIYANTLKEKQRWLDALNIYRYAVELAKRAEAPQIEWRSWYETGICFVELEDDQAALAAFRNAMAVIDHLWFLLLDEDKLRNFFQDKALLYDSASLCALRLGYSAMALEIGEKAKTRYLGDLIARRQMDPRIVLNRNIEEFWENIGRLRSTRVPIGATSSGKTERVEIVAIQTEGGEPSTRTVAPERLAALEEACQHNQELQNGLSMTRLIWQVMTFISNTEDDFYHEPVEAIYRSLLPIYQARKSAALPILGEEQESLISDYNQAARLLNEARQGGQNIPFWAFVENQSWVRDVCRATEDDEIILLLDAVMEALNTVLQKEPVFGVASDTESETQGPTLVTRTFNREAADSSRGMTIIETPLELRTQSRWSYISRLARGEIVAYRDIADTLYAKPDVAQLQFSITEYGTVIYISHTATTMKKRTGVLPDLQGEDDLHVFTNSEVTLSLLRQRLLHNEESWFTRYRHRNQQEGLQAWMKTMEDTLQWLYAHLFASLDAYLKQKGVRHLRIIPHRALHLIPFSALFFTDNRGQRHYLIDDYDIEYAPSATLQHICRERARGRSFQQSLVAIADPTSDLPFASTEVEQVISHFPPTNVRVLRSENAQLAAITPSISESVFHFAGHGHYDWDDPLASHLRFSQDDPLNLADLFAETLSLPATTLVVLSACETNITSPEDLADEYLGLASGFLFAGTPSVISTLWAVDDISTSLLMKQFYQLHFKECLHASEALRAAQRWLRDTMDYGFLVEYVQSQLATLEQRHKQVSRASKVGDDPIDPQIKLLKKRLKRLKFLRSLEKIHTSMKKPYAHPYYWAGFTINTG